MIENTDHVSYNTNHEENTIDESADWQQRKAVVIYVY